MHVLTLKVTDPEDGAYFINKALNKLHGYMRQCEQRVALTFNATEIKIHHPDVDLLVDLQHNQAIASDIKRHIFTADISAITTGHIQVYSRIHDINLEQKIKRGQQRHPKNKEIKQKQRAHFQKKAKEMEALNLRYFIVKTDKKRFTLYAQSKRIACADYPKLNFNSYGLLSTKKTMNLAENTK